MATTTIRIEDDLKARIAAAADRVGKTAHAFMLDAIVLTVEQTEVDLAFDRVADERWASVMATGETVAWNETKSWLQTRLRGEHAGKPLATKPGD